MVSDIEKTDFLKAVERANEVASSPCGIGTFKEKSLHKVLKFFFEPDDTFHEIPVGDYIADIKRSNRITEIQTAAFNTIVNRLDFFLLDHEVTVIYPVIARKKLVWIDPESGESSPPVLTPKKGRAIHVLPELYRLGDLFFDKSLCVKCVLIEVVEYRMRDGWGNGGKRGAHRLDRVPTALIDIEMICGAGDVGRLLPFASGDEFTAKEFAKSCGFSYKSTRDISMALKFLVRAELVTHVSKIGNAFVYRMN